MEQQKKDQLYQQTECNLPKMPPTQVKILGKFSNHYKTRQQDEHYDTLKIQPAMSIYCPEIPALKNDPTYKIKPKKIFADGNLIAIIDQLDNLWLISDVFAHQINVSTLIHRKVKNVMVTQNQCIISNKKAPILLNWGGKKILNMEKLQPIKILQKISRNQPNFFKAYFINCKKDDQFYYTLVKKVENTNKLYEMNVRQTLASSTKITENMISNRKICENDRNSGVIMTRIIGYPTKNTCYIREKVIGISVGKYHSLCWTSQGNVYTWGNRSIALGYENLPEEKIITKPKKVNKIKQFITMGFAGTHYSLVLSSEGNVYEWGIKQQPNLLNQQLIFEPRQVKLREGESQPKIVLMKGSKDQFGCLTSNHELYIWGQKTAQLLPPETKYPRKWKNGNLYAPVLIPYLSNVKIIDFCFGNGFMALLVAPAFSSIMVQEEQIYWQQMIRKVKHKLHMKTDQNQNLLHYKKVKTSQSQELSSRKSKQESISFVPPLSMVQNSYYQRMLKKEYFNSLKDQHKFFRKILGNQKQNPLKFLQNQSITNCNKFSTMKSSAKNIGKKIRKMSDNLYFEEQKNRNSLLGNIMGNKEDKKYLDKQVRVKNSQTVPIITILKPNQNGQQQTLIQSQCQNQLKFCTASIFNKFKDQCHSMSKRKKRWRKIGISNQNFLHSLQHKTSQEKYDLKLKRVLEKKKLLEESFLNNVAKKVQENSIQFRRKRHRQLYKAKVEERLKNVMKNTLQAFLIKNYLIRGFISPIEEARKLKIEQFARNLKLSRIQKNIRKVFIMTRVKQRMKKLSKLKFTTYAKLCYYFRRYVQRKRKQKIMKMRKIVASQLYKSIIKEKLKFGLAKTHLNVRKLQKFREWLAFTKAQRIKCLKMIWKNHLLSVVKVSSEADNALAAKSTIQNCTFENLYKQKLITNPMLKLKTFLNRSPIFQLRYEFFQSLMFLFKKQASNKSSLIMDEIKKVKRKQKIKFSGENQLFSQISGFQMHNDLLPFSLHYNMLVRPKSMEINIPQSMKKSEKWIKQQKNIYEKFLNQIIQQHEKKYRKERKQYDKQLALFIKQKYESLCEKRWKYILEYNKLKMDSTKKKKQKELYRLFDLIGALKILNDDCLPQKYLLLEEAVKRKDCPKMPSPYLSFGLHEFKDMFRKYYETVVHRSKQMRKGFL